MKPSKPAIKIREVKQPELDLNSETNSEIDSKSIMHLKQRLKELREKLFENREELGSFDFGNDEEANDDENQGENEIEIINDEETAETNIQEESSQSENENEYERGNKTFTLKKTVVSKPKATQMAPVSSITITTTKTTKNTDSINTDSLDFKALRLIEKRCVLFIYLSFFVFELFK